MKISENKEYLQVPTGCERNEMNSPNYDTPDPSHCGDAFIN
jgi:hypothetical protein